MRTYVLRRLVTSFFVLLAATAVMYFLTAYSADPLEDLRDRAEPERSRLIAARREALRLDLPVPVRYLHWLGEVGRCLVPPYNGSCTLGHNRSGIAVTEELFPAFGVSIRMVIVAVVVAMILGTFVGVVSALRYSTVFDHVVTVLTFACFSLPTFWIATLLKQYLAIDLNDWLEAPSLAGGPVLVVTVLAAVTAAGAVGGPWRRRLAAGAVGAALSGAGLVGLVASGWFERPGLGVVGIGVIGGVAAVTISATIAGWRDQRTLTAACLVAACGVAAKPVVERIDPFGPGALVGGLVATVGLSALIGIVVNPVERRLAAGVAVTTGLIVAVAVAADQMLARYPELFAARNGRPIPTSGSSTPRLAGDFWVQSLDSAVHLLLPTIALVLASFAGYVRYTRASVLDVRDADHVRTAESKGLPGRVVVVRHILRNALTPLLTLVGFDFLAVIGGSVVIETLFGWSGGMGEYFTEALRNADLNAVMGYFLLVAVAAFVINLVVDLAYGWLDPRVRIDG